MWILHEEAVANTISRKSPSPLLLLPIGFIIPFNIGCYGEIPRLYGIIYILSHYTLDKS